MPGLEKCGSFVAPEGTRVSRGMNIQDRIGVLLTQARSGRYLGEIAAQNVTLLTSPGEIYAVMFGLNRRAVEEIGGLSFEQQKSQLYSSSYMMYLFGSPLIRSYSLGNYYGADSAKNILDDSLGMLGQMEASSPEAAKDVITSWQNRLLHTQLQNPKEALGPNNRGIGLLAEWASAAPTSSLTDWTSYWVDKVAASKMMRIKMATGEIMGNDYGPGTSMLIALGVDLVMMNPTLAIRALSENVDLQALRDQFIKENPGLDKWSLLAGATAVAGIEARVALRAINLLTKGHRGRVSFQVNAGNFDENMVIADILGLGNAFDAEAAKIDSCLLQDVIPKTSIGARSHTFFKGNGALASTYGNIEGEMLGQLQASGNVDLATLNPGGVMGAVLPEGRDINVTVAGSISDGLASFFSQVAGHRKAAVAGLAVHASIITKMAGRIEAELRWAAMQKIMAALKEIPGEEAAQLLKQLSQLKDGDMAKNGLLNDKDIIRAAELAGLKLPSDEALQRVGPAICQRSHEMLTALKERFADQGVKPWETDDLLAATRKPYNGVFAHLEYTMGMGARGWFPELQHCIESIPDDKFDAFMAEIEGLWAEDSKGMLRPVEQDLVAEVAASCIGNEFREVYEPNENQARILQGLGVYKPEWGNSGLKLEDLIKHPFAAHTLLGGYAVPMPTTPEEVAAVSAGFIADCNNLAKELVEISERLAAGN